MRGVHKGTEPPRFCAPSHGVTWLFAALKNVAPFANPARGSWLTRLGASCSPVSEERDSETFESA
jgi:hypothetical protein